MDDSRAAIDARSKILLADGVTEMNWRASQRRLIDSACSLRGQRVRGRHGFFGAAFCAKRVRP